MDSTSGIDRAELLVRLMIERTPITVVPNDDWIGHLKTLERQTAFEHHRQIETIDALYQTVGNVRLRGLNQQIGC